MIIRVYYCYSWSPHFISIKLISHLPIRSNQIIFNKVKDSSIATLIGYHWTFFKYRYCSYPYKWKVNSSLIIYSYFVRSYDFDNENYMARLRSRNRRCFCHHLCSKKLEHQFDGNIYISREYHSLENHTKCFRYSL